MSTELYVYADADAPPPGDDLLEGHDDLEWEIALVRDLSSLEPVQDVDGCFALAWAAGSPRAVKIRSAIEERDAKRVMRYVADDMLALVELDVESPFEADDETVASWKSADASPEQLKRLRDAAVRYIIRTNAVRNDLSEEFQSALWLLIGAIVEGICEDPENGELIDTTEEG